MLIRGRNIANRFILGHFSSLTFSVRNDLPRRGFKEWSTNLLVISPWPFKKEVFVSIRLVRELYFPKLSILPWTFGLKCNHPDVGLKKMLCVIIRRNSCHYSGKENCMKARYGSWGNLRPLLSALTIWVLLWLCLQMEVLGTK